MRGSVQVLASELSFSPDQSQLMQIVLRESDRLNRIVSDFLTYARPPRTERAVIELVEPAGRDCGFAAEQRRAAVGPSDQRSTSRRAPSLSRRPQPDATDILEPRPQRHPGDARRRGALRCARSQAGPRSGDHVSRHRTGDEPRAEGKALRAVQLLERRHRARAWP